MKKLYHIYKCRVELNVKKLENLLNEGLNYLDEIGKCDPEPQLEKTFNKLEDAEIYLKDCFTSISGTMGSAVKYREIEWYKIMVEIWEDGNENDEDSDRMEGYSQTSVESYEILKKNKDTGKCEYSYKYLTFDDAEYEAKEEMNDDEENVYYVVKYVDGKEIEKYEVK